MPSVTELTYSKCLMSISKRERESDEDSNGSGKTYSRGEMLSYSC